MNARNKQVDTTYLSLDQAEERGFIHRDYIAHCHRWSHFVKRISQRQSYRGARILDVGCGRELPLAKLLYSSRLIPHEYVGVDYGPIPEESVQKISGGKFPAVLYDETDFVKLASGEIGEEIGLFDFITCFEVIEHVEPDHMIAMLKAIRDCLQPIIGRAFISTPCWDRVNTAANHVDEITYQALGSILEAVGFGIVAQYGTFASQSDYVQLLDEHQAKLYSQLSEYYDSNVLSTIFAPLFPHASRNCLWVLRRALTTEKPQFPKLWDCSKPWGSSVERWQQLENSGDLAKMLV